MSVRGGSGKRVSLPGDGFPIGVGNDELRGVGMRGVGLGRGVDRPPLALRQAQHERPRVRGSPSP